MSPLQNLVQTALQEDSVHDDVTTALLGEPADKPAKAQLVAKKRGIFSGKAYVTAFASVWGPGLELVCRKQEGAVVVPGDVLVELNGTVGSILRAERTLLNGLSQSCGVATLTGQFVEAVKGLPVKILATRKTLPGLRDLQLPAVQAGGGHIHRRSLSDGILIKENHQVWKSAEQLICAAKAGRSPLHKIEIEVQDLKELPTVLDQGPDIILIDNFSIADLVKAVQLIGDRATTEASGGVTLETVRTIAETGVNHISVGALTHSAPAFDISLDFVAAQK